MDLTGTTLVVGLGRSGQAAARLAVARGAERVVGVDLRSDLPDIPGVRLELGPHRRGTFLGAHRIVLSPGVPATQPDVAAAHAAGVPIVGELGFAASWLAPPMLAVTGTNGKSTVTWFVGQLLRAAGRRPFVGGNLGNPLSDAVLDGTSYDCLVVEVSSYQLEWPGALAPAVGFIINLSPDHLERHGDLAGYAAAKLRLFQCLRPDGLAVVPFGDRWLPPPASRRHAFLGAHPGVVRIGRRIEVRVEGIGCTLDLGGFGVPGEHNLDNAAAAALAALAMGATPDAVQGGLQDLRALPHRMEIVRDAGGVVWINDSKATNVDAARVGAGGLDRPAVVLLGGLSKGPGFAVLAPVLAAQRGVITFGGSGADIAAELRGAGIQVHEAATLAEAVSLARDLARPGDAVLLSPGCASFDAFDDFEHRGRVFRELAHGSPP